MIALLIGLICLVIGFGGGVAFWAQRSINYRARWQEAVALLDGQSGDAEGLKSPASEQLEAGSQAISTLTMKQLHAMASWDRVDLEKAWLKAGNPPRDDLKGLPSWDKLEIEKARIKAAKR